MKKLLNNVFIYFIGAVFFFHLFVYHRSKPAYFLPLKDLSISELKLRMQFAVDDVEKFYILGTIVHDYSLSKNISEDMKYDAKINAKLLLEVAPRFKSNWDYGNAIHDANILLGRISLFDKEMDSAKNYLIMSSKVKGSPQLDTFGPNFSLAKELLEKGEASSVVEFLDNCLIFWGSKNSTKIKVVSKWKQEIQNGNIPNFENRF